MHQEGSDLPSWTKRFRGPSAVCPSLVTCVARQPRWPEAARHEPSEIRSARCPGRARRTRFNRGRAAQAENVFERAGSCQDMSIRTHAADDLQTHRPSVGGETAGKTK